MDVLSDMLDTVRLETTVFAQTWLRTPWGIQADAREQFTFHVMPHGGGHLEVDGLEPVEVGAGDVVMLSPGRAHSLRDRPGSPVRAWSITAPAKVSATGWRSAPSPVNSSTPGRARLSKA